MKEQFPVLAEQCSFDECEEVDTVQLSEQNKAVSEELMETHEEFELATRNQEKDCYI